jgi:hypothetical protein
MRSTFIAGIFAATILFAACQKKDNTPADPDKVNIAWTQPYDGQEYHKGDTVFINSDITYSTELHGYEISITDSATGTVYFADDEHVHGDHFSINEFWVDTLSSPAKLKVQLTVEIDHDGHEASKSLYLNAR